MARRILLSVGLGLITISGVAFAAGLIVFPWATRVGGEAATDGASLAFLGLNGFLFVAVAAAVGGVAVLVIFLGNEVFGEFDGRGTVNGSSGFVITMGGAVFLLFWADLVGLIGGWLPLQPSSLFYDPGLGSWMVFASAFGFIVGGVIFGVGGLFNASERADDEPIEPEPTTEAPEVDEARSAAVSTTEERLSQLSGLHDRGVISDGEYERKRRSIIDEF